MAEFTVKLVETEEELEAAINVRMRVFVVEQQIPAEEELDDADATATHAVVFKGGEVIGTGRMLLVEGDPAGTCRVGRMSVDRRWRRHGVGGLILEFLENAARAQGMTHCLLHAQEYVKSFYAGHGYREQGEVFLEVDIPHVEMVKKL
ncbi:MAG: GNAT family N-acetyltransferase [Chloroflexota bacterium]|nr:GNAT family N-acetyltransferase [Chloroflexota bacterium]